jgi:hypothetical protein
MTGVVFDNEKLGGGKTVAGTNVGEFLQPKAEVATIR